MKLRFPKESLRRSRYAGVVFFALVATAYPSAGQSLDPDLLEMTLSEERASIIDMRRDLHRHPEVSGQEARTARVVADFLTSLGLEVTTGIGGHGVVGILTGERPGPVVAYRADMDAIRSNARDPVTFASENAGIRHICGHDIHTVVGLSVAMVLAAQRDRLPGTVKFIFQPSEENIQGARAMIRSGVLRDPSPKAIFAMHSAPMEVGTVGAVPGLGLSGFDRISISVSGRGRLEDIARQLSRSIEATSTVGPPGSPRPNDGTFIYANSFVRPVEGGSKWLVVGTIKASGDREYASAKSEVEEAVKALNGSGVTVDLDYTDRELPDMVNDVGLVNESIPALRAILGDANVPVVTSVSPYFGEDFAFFQQKIPGAMYWLGVSNSARGTRGVPHAPDFVADEESIFVGARAMSAVLWNYLETNGSENDGM